jgi:transposase-like protein
MSQHFLLSAKARTLSLSAVLRMSDEEAERAFIRVRWPSGAPSCYRCGCEIVYDCRKANGAPRWRCKACRKDFSVTSGTIFAFHKMPLRNYLAAIAIFCNEVKGKSALALSRDLNCQYKSAFVLAHKLRESMASELKARTVGGPGRTVETDGAYFGGYVKPANHRENRVDRRKAQHQTGKRQVVVVVREREGRTLPAVFKSESAALGWITSKVAKATRIMADEAGSWNDLHARYQVSRIDHGQSYSLPGGVYTNGAEEFFSRMRRAEIGHHHHVAGPYLVRYAQEAAWREDHRKLHNGGQVSAVAGLAMRCGPSVDWCGYWQRAQH